MDISFFEMADNLLLGDVSSTFDNTTFTITIRTNVRPEGSRIGVVISYKNKKEFSEITQSYNNLKLMLGLPF